MNLLDLHHELMILLDCTLLHILGPTSLQGLYHVALLGTWQENINPLIASSLHKQCQSK